MNRLQAETPESPSFRDADALCQYPSNNFVIDGIYHEIVAHFKEQLPFLFLLPKDEIPDGISSFGISSFVYPCHTLIELFRLSVEFVLKYSW